MSYLFFDVMNYLAMHSRLENVEDRVNHVSSRLGSFLSRRTSGIVTITGNGSTTEFQVEVRHNLPSDKVAVSASTTRPTTATPSYIFAYVDDKDSDGFRETIVITVRFDSAPSDGEVIEIYYVAEVVE